MLPDALKLEIEEALTRHTGSTETLRAVRALGGGCISRAGRITTARGTTAFLKYGAHAEFEPGLFSEEARSLEQIGVTGSIRVPSVIAVCDPAAAQAKRAAPAYGWLLLEWLEPAVMTHTAWEQLGRSLAALHRVSHSAFGWPAPNFIGALHQANGWLNAWPAFWRDRRIAPQFELAAGAGLLQPAERRRLLALIDRIDSVLASDEVVRPSLLHGDLWNGNVHAVTSGAPALIDPSSYFGHREVDLAMAELFGGFDRRFFDAYDEAWPRPPGHERRRLAYQLYYLLVHVNLFGGSYVAGTMSVVGKLGL